MTPGFLDRMLRSSVDRALKVPPLRPRRAAEEALYAAPAQRALVADIQQAAHRLSVTGLGLSGAAVVAARRSNGTVAVTRFDADLAAIDNRSLLTVPNAATESRHVRVADAARRFGGAVWAHPAALLTLAASHREPDPAVSSSLAAVAGRISVGGEMTEGGVTVLAGDAVLAAGSTASEAVTRLEAAERIAAITVSGLRLPDGPQN